MCGKVWRDSQELPLESFADLTRYLSAMTPEVHEHVTVISPDIWLPFRSTQCCKRYHKGLSPGPQLPPQNSTGLSALSAALLPCGYFSYLRALRWY